MGETYRTYLADHFFHELPCAETIGAAALSLVSGMRPGLFLDRDGVINVERNYVYRVEDFEFIDGIEVLCRAAQACGFAIVVVTNQAGIGRGYYSEAQFLALTEWMCARFAEHGVVVDRVYFCPFHPEHGIGEYRRESADRKPNPGLLLRAATELGIDLAASCLIGDKESDIEAARSAGLGCSVLFAPGLVAGTASGADHVVASLSEARHLLFPGVAV